MSDFRIVTSESVTEGHPDKVCDQISDAILDAIIEQENCSPDLRAAVETMITAGNIVVAGELTCSKYPDVIGIARRVLRDIGYTNDFLMGASADSMKVIPLIHEKPYDTATGTDLFGNKTISVPDPLDAVRANDQGIQIGYATDENDSCMPYPSLIAHRLAERLDSVRHSGQIPYLLPDGKTQVSVLYEGDEPVSVSKVLVSAQHMPDVSPAIIDLDVVAHVIMPVLDEIGLEYSDAKFLVNPGGDFSVGGPYVDTGLTGRKIVVDTYGTSARHGGGALSGKDCIKTDRTGAYAARWIAVNLVVAGLVRRCEVGLAYAPGIAEPFSVSVDAFGTSRLSPTELEHVVREAFDLRPESLIRALGLRRPIYRQTATYGHFGRDPKCFPWERANRVHRLRQLSVGLVREGV